MFATSRDVADFFEKRHDDVLRSADKARALMPEEGFRNFAEGSYTHPQTGAQKHRMFEMTKDGFVFLTMGFTGTKAAAFKWRYIEEFNRMEAALKAMVPQQPALPDFTDPGEAAIAWGQQYKARKEAEALAFFREPGEHRKAALRARIASEDQLGFTRVSLAAFRSEGRYAMVGPPRRACIYASTPLSPHQCACAPAD